MMRHYSSAEPQPDRAMTFEQAPWLHSRRLTSSPEPDLASQLADFWIADDRRALRLDEASCDDAGCIDPLD